MTFYVSWGRGVGSAQVSTAADLDKVLDGIHMAPDGLPYSVSIFASDSSDIPVTLEIVVGHPDRSFAYHVAAEGSSAWGYQPDLSPVSGFLFDHGGVATEAWPERTRVTPTAARAAAREFVTTGGDRPSSLVWDTGERLDVCRVDRR
jgi:hypothetical protein